MMEARWWTRLKRALTIVWVGFCLGAIGVRLWMGPHVGYAYHDLMMTLGYPITPLLWRLSVFGLFGLAYLGAGDPASELASYLLGYGMTWVGFPAAIYVQWLVIAPVLVQWALRRYRTRVT